MSEAEDRAEVEIRQSTVKTTESQVKAEIGIDSEVIRLRHEHLDAKETHRTRKAISERQRKSRWEVERELRTSKKVEVQTEDERISAVRLQLSAAKEKAIFAELEVDIIRNTIATYKMLVNLEIVDE